MAPDHYLTTRRSGPRPPSMRRFLKGGVSCHRGLAVMWIAYILLVEGAILGLLAILASFAPRRFGLHDVTDRQKQTLQSLAVIFLAASLLAAGIDLIAC